MQKYALNQQKHIQSTEYFNQENSMYLFLIVMLLFNCSGAPRNSSDNQGHFAQPQVIAYDLYVPWALDFLPDGSIIFTQRYGAVKIVSSDTVRIVGTITVAATGEAGLLGIAADPLYTQNNYIYLYYTYKDNGLVNRVSRFTLDSTLHHETVLLDQIPGAVIHNGGRIHFGPDGMLYITTGDASVASRSGNIHSLAGKILRMNKDGSIPSDNPFNNYVYASGLRNPQGIAWHNDTLYASDHGPILHDRIVRIERGADYAWPQTCPEAPALFCYTDFTLAPSGIAIVENHLYIAGLRGNQLRKIDLLSGLQEALFTDMGRLRAVVYHKGSLYITTSNRDGRGSPGENDDKIIKITLSD